MDEKVKDGNKYTTINILKSKDVRDLISKESNKLNKYLSLVALTIQNALLSILMRISRTQPKLFIASTAVVMSELLKLSYCLVVLYFHEGGFIKTYRILHKSIVKNPMDTFKIIIPSILYTIQNNLIYLGATHLDAATNQVLYQLKILTTAFFSVIILGKKLSMTQWAALFLLFMGVAMVQFTQMNAPVTVIAGREQKPMIGFLAIFSACLLSGFAGVYFEKLLKCSDLSIWVRNVQMSVFSIPCGLFTMIVTNYHDVAQDGFFYGYDKTTWATIGLQAFGGIMVAMVVKYADNILKGFATSLAIILACVLSYLFLDFVITAMFSMGAALVIASVFLYNYQGVVPLENSKPDKYSFRKKPSRQI